MEEVVKLLNLIKNEYAKIFHKKSSYIMLAFLLILIVVIPLFTKYFPDLESNDSDDYYASSIRYYESNGNNLDAEYMKAMQDAGITYNDSVTLATWKANGINTAFYTYRYNILNEKSLSKEQIEQYQKNYDNILNFINKDDWNSYFKYMITINNSDSSLSQKEKDNENYYYKYMLDNKLNPNKNIWQQKVLRTYSDNKMTYDSLLSDKENGILYDKDSFESAKSQTLISKYRLDNNISAAIYETPKEDILMNSAGTYTYSGNFYNTVDNASTLLTIVMLMVLVVAGGIIAKEFSRGTIKFLLINPIKRYKIFWSKYITVLSYAFILTVLTFLLEFVSCILIFGPSEINTQLLTVDGNSVIAVSGFVFMIGRYLLSYISIIIPVTIAFTISALFRSSALAIALSIIIYFVGSTICSVAAMFSLDFVRYTIFANQNLTSIIDGQSLFGHMSATFSVIVIIVHMFLLLFIAHDAFTRKNV